MRNVAVLNTKERKHTTGKTPHSASLEATAIMLDVIQRADSTVFG